MSARARLTIGYTVAITLLLIGFALLSYALLSRAVQNTVDDSMRKTAREAIAALEDERKEGGGTLTAHAAAEALAPFRSEDRCVILRAHDGSDIARSGPRIAGGQRIDIADITVEQARFPFLTLVPRAMAIAIVIAVIISAFVAWFLAGRALGPIESAYESQRRFMADASHELRTPVAILQGEVDVALARPERDIADYRETLEVMQRAIRQLARVVRDLFVLARADVGTMKLQKSRFYLEETIASSLRSARTLAQARGITLSESHDGEMPIDADEDLVKEMLLNLIDNAIKYSDDNSEVRVTARRNGDAYEIEVRDRGHGVPLDQQSLIFDRFYRVQHSGSGAGLGLPIARWIARAHGGDVTLRSSGDEGSIFVATLSTS